jgi:chromosome segregation ATPase
LLERLRADDHSLTQKCARLDVICEKLQMTQGRTPRAAPICLDVGHHEFELHNLTNAMRNGRDRILKAQKFIEEATISARDQQSSLESLERSFASVAYSVSSELLDLWQLSQQVADVTRNFRAMESMREAFDVERQRKVGQLSSECENARAAEFRSRDSLCEIEEYIDSFPIRLQHGKEEADAVIVKRTQLIGELERKLSAVIQEVAAEANAPERIEALTAELEGHWKDCERLTSESDRLRRTLHARQEMLERKKRIFEFAQAENVESEPGLAHVDLLYDAAKNQNASMARVMRKLQREVAVLEAEKSQYLHDLAARGYPE